MPVELARFQIFARIERHGQESIVGIDNAAGHVKVDDADGLYIEGTAQTRLPLGFWRLAPQREL